MFLLSFLVFIIILILLFLFGFPCNLPMPLSSPLSNFDEWFKQLKDEKVVQVIYMCIRYLVYYIHEILKICYYWSGSILFSLHHVNWKSRKRTYIQGNCLYIHAKKNWWPVCEPCERRWVNKSQHCTCKNYMRYSRVCSF